MSVIDILLNKNLINKDNIKEIKSRISNGEALDRILLEIGVRGGIVNCHTKKSVRYVDNAFKFC
jgi:hypothetical protein